MASVCYHYLMNIERPGLALWIWFGIGFLVWQCGIRDGALVLFCVLAGMFIYKGFVRY